jgi:hypothetical protein
MLPPPPPGPPGRDGPLTPGEVGALGELQTESPGLSSGDASPMGKRFFPGVGVEKQPASKALRASHRHMQRIIYDDGQ